jgi:hypothetical protein
VREQAIKRGQVWRNRKSGKEVCVEAVIVLSASIRYPYQDIRWCSVAKPRRRGACFSEYWHKNYELIRDAGSQA